MKRIKKLFSIILLTSISLLFILNTASSQETAGQLFEKALYLEEGKGELQSALELYQQILEQYPEDREVAAKSLLHTGMCYEKLGNREAKIAYQDVIQKYGDQKDVVKIAREQLSRLILMAEKITKTPIKPKFTKIKIPTKLSWSVRLSPDGKSLALVSEEKIFIMPLSGNIGPDFPGAPVQLNSDGINVEFSDLSWSGDGKWIAFNDPGKEGPNQSIYIVPSNGGTPEKIIENYRDAHIVNYRISLSPDGAKLAFSSVEENKQHIYTISIEGGNPILLTDMEAREPAFSPDGKLIAYVEDKNLGSGQGELGLWVVPAQGGTPHLVADAGTASSPVWSPDGNFIAFLDYSQAGHFYSKQIHIVPVSREGKTAGKVSTIDVPEGIGEVRMLAGWTPENRIGALCMTKQEFALYTLPAKGGQATLVLHDCYTLQPRWSPDGKQIIYTTPPLEGDNKFYRLFLASVPANGGNGTPLFKDQVGTFLPSAPYQGGNRLSPDGKWIIIAAGNPEEINSEIQFPSSNIWKIAVDGSESTQLTNEEGPYADLCPSWSPDGRKVAFVRIPLQSGMNPFGSEQGIYIIDSSGGESDLLISLSDKPILSPVWSPDGKMIAYLTADQPHRSNPTMNVINVNNGESRVIGEVPEAHVNIELAWSPDSKRIAFNGKKVHVMNVADGSIEDIETNLVDVKIWHLDWSPDGEQFVFAGGKGGNDEFWFLEDFLPLEKLAQFKETEGIRIKQVWKKPYLDDLGTVSSDGRFRSCVDWGNGDLAIHNVVNGQIRQLTHNANLGDTSYFVLQSAISKNGKKIVSSWWKPNHTTDLILVDVENPSPQIIYRHESEEVYPVTWLSDEIFIFRRYFAKTENMQICSFNITDRTVHPIKILDSGQPQISCSPDEKYIAYDFKDKTNNGNFDINIIQLEGSKEISMINHKANDRVLGWVPGRKEFLFISDRSGTWDIWAIPLDEGKPAGPVKRIYTDIGEVQPLGFTQNGDCFFGFSRRNFNTYIAPFDLETGEIKEQSGESILGSNIWVKWSPDGQNLTYIKLDKKAVNSSPLTIQDLKTGEERILGNNLKTAMSPCWSPDGMSILVVGRDKNKDQTKDYKGGIYQVDVETGQTTEVLLLSDYKYNLPDDDAFPLSDIEWSADGSSIFFLFFKDRLMKHDLDTGKDKILYKHSNFERGTLNRSPDGKSLLFGVKPPNGNKSLLLTLPVEGGKEKELCTTQEADGFGWGCFWSPDGKYIYFTERSNGTNLWRVPAEGGIPQKIWHSEDRTEVFSIHPDGKQIALAIRERTTEVRVIENLVQELEKIDNISKK
jgi:Tol biopolymer transport system component